MSFLAAVYLIILIFAPYWLLIIACNSEAIRTNWSKHGTLVSMALAALTVLSRTAITLPDTDQYVGTFADSIGRVVMAVDMILLTPLYELCDELAGKPAAAPDFAIITYGLVVYFAIYRLFGAWFNVRPQPYQSSDDSASVTMSGS